MDAKSCTRNARNNISSNLKHQLALESNFACSICGKIPIVFHHIEEWSKEHSNDYSVLIPICDLCHRRIHGEGGNLFSKNELYKHKKNPKRPLLLKDKLPLDSKRSYSFFLGNNFITDGSKANLYGLPGGNHLTTIDVSSGNLKLSILEKIVDGEKFYLIKENELMIDTTDIWDMRYSGNSLKIWKNADGRKNIFIDLIIRPALIIIKRMETTFNGQSFRIYKYRAPHKNQVVKLQQIIQSYEVKHIEFSEEIDALPKKYGSWNGFDLDSFIKQNQKDEIKRQCEREILDGCENKFKWKVPYCYKVVHKLFEDSEIFRSRQNIRAPLSKEHERMNMHISKIKEEYAEDFEALEDTVVEYGGMILDGNIMI